MPLVLFRRLRVVRGIVVLDVLPHEVTNDLSGGTVLRPTHFDEFVSKVALHSDTKPGILSRHWGSVSNVATKGKSKPEVIVSEFTHASKGASLVVVQRRNAGAHPICAGLAHVSKEHGEALGRRYRVATDLIGIQTAQGWSP